MQYVPKGNCGHLRQLNMTYSLQRIGSIL